MSCSRRLTCLLLMLTALASVCAAQESTEAIRIKRKSTTGAVLRSLVVPGLGQFYNESYYKAAAFAFIEGVQISGIYGFHNKMLAAKRENYFPEQYTDEEDRLAAEQANREADANEMRYRERRNKTLWWFTGVVILSLGDAYVDAQLYGIDVSPNLSFNPDLTAGVTASISF